MSMGSRCSLKSLPKAPPPGSMISSQLAKTATDAHPLIWMDILGMPASVPGWAVRMSGLAMTSQTNEKTEVSKLTILPEMVSTPGSTESAAFWVF